MFLLMVGSQWKSSDKSLIKSMHRTKKEDDQYENSLFGSQMQLSEYRYMMKLYKSGCEHNSCI